MDTDIDERISARVRWDLVGNNGNNEWNGRDKNTAKIKISYLKFKDTFNSDGVILIGRDKFYHGHGFVVYDYMDAVNYTKKCGDIDLALNIFFEKEGINSVFNIFNINADYRHNGHDMYFGFYYDNKGYDDYGAPLDDKRKEFRYELGSISKLSNKSNKYTYDFGMVGIIAFYFGYLKP